MKKYLLLLLTMLISMVGYAEGTGTQDDPVILTESGSITLPESGWGHYYFQYTADMDGDVVFSTSEWHDFDIQILPTEATYNGCSYSDKQFAVTNGTTYVFDLYMYLSSSNRFKVTLPHIVKDGDFEKPIDLTAGTSVELGDAAGTLWASYTAAEAGKVTFAGNQGIISSIKVFKSKSDAESYLNYNSDYYVMASTETNSLTVNVAAGSVYYVAIVKVNMPMGNNFKATFAPYEPGDAKEMPIDATVSPYETTIAAGATMWFKVGSTTAGQYKSLAIVTDDAAYIHNGYNYDYYGTSYWSDGDYYTGSKTFDIGSDWYDCEHIVSVQNTKDEAISVKLTVTTPQPGENKKTAIDINESLPYEGTLAAGATKWVYVTVPYGTTKDIKVVASSATAKITLEDYYANSKASGLGTVEYTDKANWGQDDVYIQIVNADASDITFTVTMVDHEFGPGETREKAIDISETGVYTFDATTTDVWVKYTAAETGTMKIILSAAYDWNNNVKYYVGDDTGGNYLDNNSEYVQMITAVAGTTYYVHASLSSTVEGQTITFAPYTPEPGELYTDAAQVYNNDEFTVPAGKTRWFKFESTAKGWDVTLSTNNTAISVKLYNSIDDIDGNSINVSFTDWGDGNGPVATPYVAAGMNYIKVTNTQDEDVTLKISGTITTFHEHVYATEWTTDETYHWHVCTAVEGCQEISDKGEHTFGDDRKCTVCGFVKPYAVTVAEGDAYNSYAPFYSYYADTQGTQTSTIYEASLLSELQNKNITNIKYYLAAPATETGATFDVYVSEVEATTLAELPTELGTKVYTGEFNYASNCLNIVLDEAYKYNGGNLMITTVVASPGSYPQASWSGVYAEGASYSNRGGVQNFIPKTQFGYEVEEEPVIALPEGYVAISNPANFNGINVILMNAAGEFLYGPNAQNTGVADYATATSADNAVTGYKLEQDGDAYLFRCVTPAGDDYGLWGQNPCYLNSQPNVGGVSFNLGKDQDIANGSSWNLIWNDEAQAFAIVSVANGGYLAGSVVSADPAYWTIGVSAADIPALALETTVPEAGARVTTAPEKVLMTFNLDITSVDSAAVIVGENEPVIIAEDKATVQDGNTVAIDLAGVELALGNIKVGVFVNGVDSLFETNFTLAEEFKLASSTLGANGGQLVFTQNIDFADGATEIVCNVVGKNENLLATQATLTLDSKNFAAVNVQFANELNSGNYILNIPENSIVSIYEEAYAGEVEFTVPALKEGDYLIVNAEGGYIGGGTSWGTRATLIGKPQWFTVTIQDGKYLLNSHQSNGGAQNYLADGLYCDANAYGWTIEAQDEENTLFTIATADGRYLSANEGMNKPINLVAEADLEMNMNHIWAFVPMSVVLANMETATEDEGVDVTCLIKDPELKRNGNTEGYWTITGFDGEGKPSNWAEGQGGNNTSCAESYHSNNGFKAVQTITLPLAGKYTLSAQAFYRQDDGAEEALPYLFAGEQTSTFPERTGTENNMVEAYAAFLAGTYPVAPIEIEATEDGQTIEIGFAGEANHIWNIFGELELLYYGTPVVVYELPEGHVAITEAEKLENAEVILMNVATGEILYGKDAQNTAVAPWEEASATSNVVTSYKIEKADNGYLFRCVTPAGGDYSLWGANPCYLNSQPNVGGVTFNLGKDQDCTDGSTWALAYDDKAASWTVQSVANNGYLAGNTVSAEPTAKWVIGEKLIPSAISAVATASELSNGKYVENGKIIIVRNGVKYNTTGVQIIK